MVLSRKQYKYSVHWQRDTHWWASTWREMSNWCTDVYGPVGEWEFFDDAFQFKTEKDKMLFILRWS